MRQWLLAAALDVLAPEACAFCGITRRGVPWFRWPGSAAPGIRPWDAPHLCGPCFEARAGDLLAGRVAEHPLLSPLATSAELTAAVGLWKYHGVRGLGAPLAAWLAPALAAAMAGGQPQVVPVPLHRGRRRARGFDQVVQLAGLAASLLGEAVAGDILQRRRATAQQASQETAGEARIANVAGAFGCRGPRATECPDVVLVDDLATTGATLGAVVAVVEAAGWRVAGCVALGQARRLIVGEGLDTGVIRPHSVARTDATCPLPAGSPSARSGPPLEE